MPGFLERGFRRSLAALGASVAMTGVACATTITNGESFVIEAVSEHDIDVNLRTGPAMDPVSFFVTLTPYPAVVSEPVFTGTGGQGIWWASLSYSPYISRAARPAFTFLPAPPNHTFVDEPGQLPDPFTVEIVYDPSVYDCPRGAVAACRVEIDARMDVGTWSTYPDGMGGWLLNRNESLLGWGLFNFDVTATQAPAPVPLPPGAVTLGAALVGLSGVGTPRRPNRSRDRRAEPRQAGRQAAALCRRSIRGRAV